MAARGGVGPPPLPHLVVVPLSTLPNWQREFARFAPQLNVVALTGNAEVGCWEGGRGTGGGDFAQRGCVGVHAAGAPALRGGQPRSLLTLKPVHVCVH